MAGTMIERVAQELAKESGVSDWVHVSEHGDYDSRDYWRRLARSSFVAMREPTDAMIRAAGDGPADRSCWQRVIDAAISEIEI